MIYGRRVPRLAGLGDTPATALQIKKAGLWAALLNAKAVYAGLTGNDKAEAAKFVSVITWAYANASNPLIIFVPPEQISALYAPIPQELNNVQQMFGGGGP